MIKQNYNRVTIYENRIITRLKHEVKKLLRDVTEKKLATE